MGQGGSIRLPLSFHLRTDYTSAMVKRLIGSLLALVTVVSLLSGVLADGWSRLEKKDGYRSGDRTVSVANGSGQPEETVEIAVGFLGTPYLWSGSTPVQGFDSSGFVHEVLRLNQISIPRSLDGQHSKTRVVSRNNLTAGDLVFFGDRTGRPDQVGVYIGDDKFVHASPEAKAVVLSRLSNSYYGNRLLSIHRPQGSPTAETMPDLIQILEDAVPNEYITTHTTTVRLFREKEPLPTGPPVLRSTSRYSIPRYYTDRDQDLALFEPEELTQQSSSHPLTLRAGEVKDIVLSAFPAPYRGR